MNIAGIIAVAAAIIAGVVYGPDMNETGNYATGVEIGGMISGTVYVNGQLIEPDENGNINTGNPGVEPEAPIYEPIPWD